jgi:CRP-like cAMP-binding protein
MNVPLFQEFLLQKLGLNPEQFLQCTSEFQVRTVPKNTMLLQEGAICQFGYFVEQGLVRTYSVDDQGKEHVIQFSPEGWFFADRSSAYFQEPAEYFIETIEDSILVELDPFFSERIAQVVNIPSHYHTKSLHNHIRFLQKRINSLLAASAEKRYLEFTETYPDILLRVPQWMVASYLGITPEGLSRVRKQLAQKHS